MLWNLASWREYFVDIKRIMPPNSQEETPAKGKQVYCGLGNHKLQTPNKALRNRVLLSFAKKINPEIREGTLLCLKCYIGLEKIFHNKLRSKRQHEVKKNATGSSISDVSNSQSIQTSSSEGSSTAAVRAIAQQVITGSSESSVVAVPSPSPESSRSSDRPTTSAAAAARRKRKSDEQAAAARRKRKSDEQAAAGNTSKRSRPPPDPTDSDDDPNSNLSLNAVNGTRLPHIQPIPKRRPTIILNKAVMDIYLAGTTGG
ncbi:uncharacterized protein Dana_GF10272 [Drosophila ananassae]|uniref:Uncharacterized protein n=1 Tax=Drosophila ananassae TaxID=7217 RepID=B3M837_DROAN|nr:uncharacterized protein LOC6493144 [Drosophila ananassae]EDV39945.2 uncharacterized protein Dana_GF10272 [Drosophila ananassae]